MLDKRSQWKEYNFIINIITYWCFRSNVTRIVERRKSKVFPASPIFLPSLRCIFQVTEQQNLATSNKNTDLNKLDKLNNKENTWNINLQKGIIPLNSIHFIPFPPLPRERFLSLTLSLFKKVTYRSRNDFQLSNDPRAISLYLSDLASKVFLNPFFLEALRGDLPREQDPTCFRNRKLCFIREKMKYAVKVATYQDSID